MIEVSVMLASVRSRPCQHFLSAWIRTRENLSQCATINPYTRMHSAPAVLSRPHRFHAMRAELCLSETIFNACTTQNEEQETFVYYLKSPTESLVFEYAGSEWTRLTKFGTQTLSKDSSRNDWVVVGPSPRFMPEPNV